MTRTALLTRYTPLPFHYAYENGTENSGVIIGCATPSGSVPLTLRYAGRKPPRHAENKLPSGRCPDQVGPHRQASTAFQHGRGSE